MRRLGRLWPVLCVPLAVASGLHAWWGIPFPSAFFSIFLATVIADHLYAGDDAP